MQISKPRNQNYIASALSTVSCKLVQSALIPTQLFASLTVCAESLAEQCKLLVLTFRHE